MLKPVFQLVGNNIRGVLADAGALWRLAAASLDLLFLGPFRGERFRFRPAIFQTVKAGYNSLPLVMLLLFLTGMIMALHFAQELDRFGATDMVANLVAVAIIRELAPLLTAIIVAGRFGSAIAAELGTMKVSQEIDALTVMGIDPISFLVIQRLFALFIALPCLTIFANLMGILGGLVVAVGTLEISVQGYLVDSLRALALEDIVASLVKAFVFAGIIGLVGCQQGLQTRGGAEAVGRSTTASVVRSIVLIIGADLFVTAFFYIKG